MALSSKFIIKPFFIIFQMSRNPKTNDFKFEFYD
jgi:hypothetical protein